MKKNYLIILLIVVSFIPLLNLFHPGLPHGHDTQDHVARIANFYRNLEEGVFVPRWAANLDWGYGHPILMFLYPFSSYSTSLIHLFGFSFVDSTKIFFGLAFILSGLTMYLWLKEFLSKESAFVGAMLYMFAPYRFIDLYVRGAIGEHAAFIFPPLVLYFLVKLSKSLDSGLRRNDSGRSYWYLLGGAFSLAGLILAHNAISLMFLPVIFLYALYLIWNSENKKFLLFSFLFLVFFGFMLSAFFWMPAFLEGKYTLRDIVTGGEVLKRFVLFNQFLYGPWSYGGTGQFSVQIGIVQWLAVFIGVVAAFLVKRKKDTYWIPLVVSLGVFFFTLFFMAPYSMVIWENVSTLQKFQFPWRFLSLTVFLSAFIGAIVVNDLGLRTKDSRKKSKIILIIFICLVLFVNKDYWQPKDYLYKPENFYTGIYDSTTDTGESAPIWSVRFMEKRPKALIEVINGKAKVIVGARNSIEHKYTIEASEKARLRENTLYFPGWKVFVDGSEVPIQFQDAKNRGVMTFTVEKGKHEVMLKFGETKLRLLADLISALSVVLLLGWGIVLRKGIVDRG